MNRFTRLVSLLSVSAFVVGGSLFSISAPANAKSTMVHAHMMKTKSGKVVLVKAHTRVVKPKGLVKVHGYTKVTKSGKVIKVKGYTRKPSMKSKMKM